MGSFRFCMCTARGGCSQSVAEDGPSLCDSCCWEQPTPGRSGCGSGGLMGVILQVALPSRVLAAARLQCGAAGAGASRGLGVCAEHARLAARGESARAMEIGDFLGRLRPGGNSQVTRNQNHGRGQRDTRSFPNALKPLYIYCAVRQRTIRRANHEPSGSDSSGGSA